MSWGAAPDRRAEWWMVSRRTVLEGDFLSWNWYDKEAEATKNRDYYIAFATNAKKTDQRWTGTDLGAFSLPSWSAINHHDLDRFDPALVPSASLVPPDRVYTFWEVAQGWPFRCLRGTQLTAVAAFADMPFQAIGLSGDRAARLMALTPIPSGLLADSLIYSAALVALCWAFARLRARRRRLRAQCTWCGYDRRGLEAGAPCPECGYGAT
jgi:hypothetical protein